MQQLLESLQLNAGHVEILPSGYHTQVTLIIHNGQHSVVKIISKKEFVDRMVAEELSRDIRTYHAMLRQVGILVPDISRIELLPSSTGHDLVLIVPFEGYDAERKIESGELTVAQVAEGVLHALKPLFLAHKDFVLDLGVDPKPANFVSCNGNNFHYVDWMPPRFVKNGVPLVEYEPPKSQEGQELAYFRSYDLRGILLVLQSQLSKLNPHARPAVKSLIFKFAGEVGPKIQDYLTSLVSETVFSASAQEAASLVFQLQSRNIYELREIACELVCRGRANSDFLAKAFQLTHFYDDVPEPKRFQQARDFICSYL